MCSNNTIHVPNLKVCTKCGEAKPATTEFFALSSRNSSGFQSACKKCNNAWYAANKEKRQDYNRAYRESNRAKATERMRMWRSKNRERELAREKKRREQKPELFAEKARRYNLAHKEENAERRRRYVAMNREMVRARNQRRRTRKMSAEGTHTGTDIQAQYERQRGKCYYCGKKVGKNYHVDHVVPLSRGGTNDPDNLVIACPSCNTSKCDKLPHEWSQGGRLL